MEWVRGPEGAGLRVGGCFPCTKLPDCFPTWSSCEQALGVPGPPWPCQHLVWLFRNGSPCSRREAVSSCLTHVWVCVSQILMLKCGTSFHVLICHLCISGEVSSPVPCPFLIGLFVFLLLSPENFIYVLDKSPLSDTSFAGFFPSSLSFHSQQCLSEN